MSHKRNVTFAAVAVLAVVGAIFITLPTQAEGYPELTVTVEITSTFPQVSGIVTATDENGAPVDLARVSVASSYDTVPGAPKATSSGATDAAGTFRFAFSIVSTAAAPGAHSVTVFVAGPNAINGTASTTYTVSA